MKLTFFKSLRFRVMMLFIVIGILPSAAIKHAIVRNYEERAVDVRSMNVKNQCDILGAKLMRENYLEHPESEVINSSLTMLASVYNGRVMIINKDFKIIKDTYNIDGGKYTLSEEVIKCFQGENTVHYDQRNAYLVVTSPIKNQRSKTVEGVMLMSISTGEIVESIAILEQNGNLLLVSIAVLVIVLGYMLSAVLMRPFARITRSIEDLMDGSAEEEISVSDYTETELITNAFNKMMNRMKVLDESRQEFVSNVSHELKTPMTSIKVLADSLVGQENVPVELYQEFMQDITVEIDRENEIITDLLSLVKMDKKAADLNVAETDINQLLESILKRLKPIADKKKVELILESIRPVKAQIDQTKLSLALTNLVENGIKYNVKDGWVRVTLNADHKYFYVTIADSGMGIPEDSVDRIFERFYRVDKSHSREIGGTGLGLAITKSAIVVHRGAIRVKSKENEGTTFSIRVPLIYIR